MNTVGSYTCSCGPGYTGEAGNCQGNACVHTLKRKSFKAINSHPNAAPHPGVEVGRFRWWWSLTINPTLPKEVARKTGKVKLRASDGPYGLSQC